MKNFGIKVILGIVVAVTVAGSVWYLSLSRKEPLGPIVVAFPKEGSVIQSPIEVRGKARGIWYFEADFPVIVLDADGKILGQGSARAEGDWMTEDFVPFSAHIAFDNPGTPAGIIRLKKNNPSDLPEHDAFVDIPVSFSQFRNLENLMNVKIFFGNSSFDPQALYCEKVYPVTRLLEKTPRVAESALRALLEGPNESEKQKGYFTSIPNGVRIQSIALRGDVLSVDFSDELDRVAGSCRVLAIRAQIEETLRQFPTVKNIVISIDGRIEDILQP